MQEQLFLVRSGDGLATALSRVGALGSGPDDTDMPRSGSATSADSVEQSYDREVTNLIDDFYFCFMKKPFQERFAHFKRMRLPRDPTAECDNPALSLVRSLRDLYALLNIDTDVPEFTSRGGFLQTIENQASLSFFSATSGSALGFTLHVCPETRLTRVG